MQHFISLADWASQDILDMIEKGKEVKAHPEKYHQVMAHRTLVMMFEKPSLRTHLSFDIAAAQAGGHAIYYNLGTSPLGKKKESPADTIKVISRYADLLMARLFSHQMIEEMAKHSSIPIINGLTNFNHPCQILADLMTISEKKGNLKGLKLAYLGDACNNVTHSLLYGCAQTGISIAVGCPAQDQFSPSPAVIRHARTIAESKVEIFDDARSAIEDADVVYTDSWMSYHISPEESTAREEMLMPFQVNEKLMKYAKPDAVFMNCLPAMRGYEQTKEVIDGPASIVFDQAENRLHAQKALMITLLEKTNS